MPNRDITWTNTSVLKFAHESDPVDLITKKARGEVLQAIQAGWQGPPFDPFWLAEHFNIPVVPREDILDARILPAGPRRLQIEFNPHRSRGRLHFSVAHELAHTLFPDCFESIRNRELHTRISEDDWQLELLCNIAAAEFLMPAGNEIDSRTPVTIDNVLRLQKEFDVSTEAISIRLAKITSEPCTIFAAARILDEESATSYRTDYSIRSRASKLELPRGQEFKNTILSQCTAVGYTAKGKEQAPGSIPELYLECIGIPPYPGRYYPRVIGIAHTTTYTEVKVSSLTLLRGNALEPRGIGDKIVAHIVNDKTPNWGAGFGRAVKKEYPSAQKDFSEWITRNPNDYFLGNVHISTISDELSFVHMIAQHGYGESTKPRIRYDALKNCLEKLKDIALRRGASVHMPRIGTGYAGGNWSYILELIDEILVRNNVDVTIYTLPDYEPTEAQVRLNSRIGIRP
jgi:Zn-dependent peptidase ImmA (M78 family)